MSKLKREYVPSETVVMEHAFVLISKGLLNIPDVGRENVKQARAFLWNAAWLQEYMNKKLRDEGLLPRHAEEHAFLDIDHFALAIMGPGGTGKTAVLRMVEALTVCFAGVDTVRKLAPSNAAARLLGGDTLHAQQLSPESKVGSQLMLSRGIAGNGRALFRHLSMRSLWFPRTSSYNAMCACGKPS